MLWWVNVFIEILNRCIRRMKKKDNMKMNAQSWRGWRFVFGGVFLVMGVGRIYLWNKNVGNDFGLYLGLSFLAVAIVWLWPRRKK